MALGRVKGSSENSYALAWTEMSTGSFRVAETNADRLLSDILRVDPKELIVADTVFHDAELKTRLRRARPHRQSAAGGALRFRRGVRSRRALLRHCDA